MQIISNSFATLQSDKKANTKKRIPESRNRGRNLSILSQPASRGGNGLSQIQTVIREQKTPEQKAKFQTFRTQRLSRGDRGSL